MWHKPIISIDFSSVQKVEFLALLEDHGYSLSISNNDERDNAMFTDLLFTMARSLDQDQADYFNKNL